MHLADLVIGSEASIGDNHFKKKYSGLEHRRLSLAAKELNWSQKQFNDYVNARPNKFRLKICLKIEVIEMKCRKMVIFKKLKRIWNCF